MPLAAVLTVFGVMIPLICWFGLANPNLVPGLFHLPWNNPGAMIAAVATVLILFFAPLIWMLVSRRGDLVAMWLMQNALLAGGYFFLPETSEQLNQPNLGPAILDAGVSVVVVNTLGFLILLPTLGFTCFFAKLARVEIKPLSGPPKNFDRRLVGLLRIAALFCVGSVVLSMAVTHTVPMLASDPQTARYVFDDNGITRPLFNVNMAILPFVSGGLLVMFFRNPRRYLGLDGWLAGMVLLAELLSGDRFPLAIAAIVTITLLSMEKRWPRWLLAAAVTGYCVLFIGLSGFTSIWRQNREVFSSKENLVVSSFRQAYIGNNLIDYRDAAWVFSQWDHQPLMGKTYAAGMLAMMPSSLLPERKQWHLGQTALRIVGWGDYQHFGLRISCFGESFLNFGFAGVVGLAVILGVLLGSLSHCLNLLSKASQPPCLARNLTVVMLIQMLLVWTNTSDAFMFWALLALLIGIKAVVFFGGGRMTIAGERRLA